MKHTLIASLLIVLLSGCTMSPSTETAPPTAMNMNGATIDHVAMVTSEESFMVEMIPHHQEAVDASTQLLAKTQDPELKSLLGSIITTQTSEIEMMQNRLKRERPNSTLTTHYEPMMRDTSAISAITTIQTMYLEDMVKHHQGAVEMAEALIALNPSPELKDYARQIIETQQSEVKQMEDINKRLSATGQIAQ